MKPWLFLGGPTPCPPCQRNDDDDGIFATPQWSCGPDLFEVGPWNCDWSSHACGSLFQSASAGHSSNVLREAPGFLPADEGWGLSGWKVFSFVIARPIPFKRLSIHRTCQPTLILQRAGHRFAGIAHTLHKADLYCSVKPKNATVKMLGT